MTHFQYLTTEDLLTLASALMGNPPPVRDLGLIESAAARPQTTVFGDDAYPSVWEKAAALLLSIVKHHPLVDGNKRLGWLSTAVFLELNGQTVDQVTNDDIYTLIVEVASGKFEVAEVAARLTILCAGET